MSHAEYCMIIYSNFDVPFYPFDNDTFEYFCIAVFR